VFHEIRGLLSFQAINFLSDCHSVFPECVFPEMPIVFPIAKSLSFHSLSFRMSRSLSFLSSAFPDCQQLNCKFNEKAMLANKGATENEAPLSHLLKALLIINGGGLLIVGNKIKQRWLS